jgi:hypothetical protein
VEHAESLRVVPGRLAGGGTAAGSQPHGCAPIRRPNGSRIRGQESTVAPAPLGIANG